METMSYADFFDITLARSYGFYGLERPKVRKMQQMKFGAKILKPGESKKNNCKNRKLLKIRKKNRQKRMSISLKKLGTSFDECAAALKSSLSATQSYMVSSLEIQHHFISTAVGESPIKFAAKKLGIQPFKKFRK